MLTQSRRISINHENIYAAVECEVFRFSIYIFSFIHIIFQTSCICSWSMFYFVLFCCIFSKWSLTGAQSNFGTIFVYCPYPQPGYLRMRGGWCAVEFTFRSQMSAQKRLNTTAFTTCLGMFRPIRPHQSVVLNVDVSNDLSFSLIHPYNTSSTRAICCNNLIKKLAFIQCMT